MVFSIQKESLETKRLIELFKKSYVDGEGDAFLTEKAKEIFGRLDEETKHVRGNSAVVQLVDRCRKEFEQVVVQVCTNRGSQATQALGKYYREHKKKHP
jgi:uncharacterized protein with PIN domain